MAKLNLYIIPLRSLVIILLLTIPLLSENTASDSATGETDTVIINEIAGPPDTLSDALVSYMDYKKINEWALTLNMTAVEDSPPVIDGIAFFPVHPQIEIPVNGLKKGRQYYLYIDFVKYLNGKVRADSFLKIFIRDIYGKKVFLTKYFFLSLYNNEKFKTEIPFNLSNPGSFTIIIQEYSDKPGYWGIWDIIISSRKIEDITPVTNDIRPEIREIEPKIFK